MGGVDTRDRYHVHWGPAEQYAERREESALRRSGRPVPDRTFDPFEPIDLAPLDAILAEEGHRPRRSLAILERTQEAYGHLPVAALQHVAHQTGAWYSELYGIATLLPAPALRAARQPRRARLPLHAVRAARRRPGAGRLPRAPRHGRRRPEPGRRRAPRDDRLPRRVVAAARAWRSTARSCRARRRRMPRASRPPCAPTWRRGRRHEPAHPAGRARLALRAPGARRAGRPGGRHRGG